MQWLEKYDAVSFCPHSVSFCVPSHYQAQQLFIHRLKVWMWSKVATDLERWSEEPSLLSLLSSKNTRSEASGSWDCQEAMRKDGGGKLEVTKQVGKKKRGRREISEGVKSWGRHGKGRKASWEKMKEMERMTKTLRIKFLLNCNRAAERLFSPSFSLKITWPHKVTHSVRTSGRYKLEAAFL